MDKIVEEIKKEVSEEIKNIVEAIEAEKEIVKEVEEIVEIIDPQSKVIIDEINTIAGEIQKSQKR